MAEPTRSRKPGPRSWARRCAAQAIYEWQMTGQLPSQIAAQFIADEDLNKADPDFFRELVHQIPARLADIDAALQPFLDRPLTQVDPVERAILRIGGYELLQHPELACRIVINEAVELAKLYGSEKSGSFINGVLGQLMRDEH